MRQLHHFLVECTKETRAGVNNTVLQLILYFFGAASWSTTSSFFPHLFHGPSSSLNFLTVGNILVFTLSCDVKDSRRTEPTRRIAIKVIHLPTYIPLVDFETSLEISERRSVSNNCTKSWS